MHVGRDPLAYSRLLAGLWEAGDAFLVVEHDVEPTAEAVTQAAVCSCPWSVSPYKGSGPSHAEAAMLTGSLGCTRFSAALLAEVPDAMQRANALNDGASVCPPGHWQRLDARLLHVLRDAGFWPHQHVPVLHHHVYAYGCACGEDHPPKERS